MPSSDCTKHISRRWDSTTRALPDATPSHRSPPAIITRQWSSCSLAHCVQTLPQIQRNRREEHLKAARQFDQPVHHDMGRAFDEALRAHTLFNQSGCVFGLALETPDVGIDVVHVQHHQRAVESDAAMQELLRPDARGSAASRNWRRDTHVLHSWSHLRRWRDRRRLKVQRARDTQQSLGRRASGVGTGLASGDTVAISKTSATKICPAPPRPSSPRN